MGEQLPDIGGQVVVFTLDGQRLALPLSSVERALRAVAVTPLPGAPPVVLGVINAGGQVLPVVELRRRLGLPSPALGPDQRLLLARGGRRTLALVADSVAGVWDLEPSQVAQAEPGLAFAPHLRGVAKLPEGLLLIYDLEGFLSLEEEKQLQAALEGSC